MLDQENGDLEIRADAADEVHQALFLVVVQAGRGLVEQQQLGACRERPGPLHPALVAVGQVPRQPVLVVADAHEIQALFGHRMDLGLFQVLARSVQNGPEGADSGPAVHSGHHVLQHGHVLEQAQVLERSSHAFLCDPMGFESHDRLPLEPDVACVGPIEPREAIEDRGLACAVRADEADDGAFLDIEAEPVDDVQPSELQRQIVNV